MYNGPAHRFLVNEALEETEAPTSEAEVPALEELVEEEEGTEPSVTSVAAPVTGDDFLSFYGLRENPFSDSVDPEYFYRTKSHEEAFTRMLLTVDHSISLGLVTGPSGSGKTLVSQILLQHLSERHFEPILVLVTPGMSKTALVKEILAELGIQVPQKIGTTTQDLVNVLSRHVIDLYNHGRRLVVLIDECHFLRADSLHILRTISNIEIPNRKLSTCLLFGEERFLKRLAHPSYESLRNRIYLKHSLRPLDAGDCAQYIKFRALKAGRMEELFDDDALALIHSASGGIGRQVNKLCMLSLLEGYFQGKERIDKDVVVGCVERE